MAVFKTLQFLPEIFRTETNKKFLNATVDQLYSEPNLVRINGYIGRKLAPSYKANDSYITEPTQDRQNYQLEPSVIIKDPVTQELNFATTYTDIVNKINFYGGLTSNHNRLFDNEYYSYDPQIDLDKFINFVQYYWLENGPDAVTISALDTPLERNFNATFDATTNTYNFVGFDNISNPLITLARGGTYTFTVNDPDNKFYIQSKPGSTGVDPTLNNLNTREVLGVTNNGADVGTISFTVPTSTAQIQWTSMPIVDNVNFATNLSYQTLQGCLLSELSELGGLDGPTTSYDNTSVVFINNSFIDDTYWHNTARVLDNVIYLDQDNLIPQSQRTSIYQINVYPDSQGDLRIYLSQKFEVSNENKVRIVAGASNSGKEFYKRTNIYFQVPNITAPLDYLYYQSDQSDTAFGTIKLALTIDPDNEIIGEPNYVSPSGVNFTNGLKVEFDSTAVAPYTNNTYYVEGVGTAIKLVDASKLVSSELDYNYSTPDYITINRSSIDQNAWSRSNRWFHVEVIEKTAEYNNTELILDQNVRAQRPIIEFNSDLQLYNFGVEAKDPIDVLDTLITNAFSQVQGVVVPKTTAFAPTSAVFSLILNSSELRVGRTYEITTLGTTNWEAAGAPVGYTVGTTFVASAAVAGTGTATDLEVVVLNNGDRVVFTADEDLNIRNKIYRFSIELFSESPEMYRAYIQETDDSEVLEGNTVAVNSGTNGSKQWHFNGESWIESQQKTAVNQPPQFDIVSNQGISLSNQSVYNNSNFVGTKLFSYKSGTGNNDPVLGFPVSYKNLQTQGDLLFENNFDVDTFAYRLSSGLEEISNINIGFLQKNLSRTTNERLNIWNINLDFTKQYQLFNYIYDGQTNLFPIDILPDQTVDTPNVKITINNQRVANGNWAITQTNNKLAILINPEILTADDVVFISIFNSKDTSQQGFYEIPLNYDINALNNDITTLTLGQIRNHLIGFKNNSTDIIGDVPGKSNIRDINFVNRGGTIVQHSAPAVYAGLFLNHPTMNFVESLRLASKEYTQFKQKFLEHAANLELDRNNVAASVDTILLTINNVKNSSFPWFYSDMVPYGDDEKVVLPSYQVFDPEIRSYEITNIFQDTVISNKAVLVYITRTLNNITTTELLVKDRDYTFDQTRPAINIADNFILLIDDILTIVEYNNTDGSYIPETPTKLGIYPKFEPVIYTDNTYRTPITVIQGHDGSITPAFGDFRDKFLLELERRIYNNIKIEYNVTNFNINDYIPGKFRLVDYTRAEFDQLIGQSFLRWVGTNRIDYTTNSTFVASDPFTWNYKKFRDVINGESLPGTWRSVFRYFFDTDRPHTHPWEMLGFSEKPDYWVDRYGPAPYTGGNLVLWSDLEAGYIHAGTRAGIDFRYSRPGLTQIIPVDDSGNLRSPSEFLVTDYDSAAANVSYAVGDIGPSELAWRRSSDYPFAIHFALALAKPARYFGLLIDVENYYRDVATGQFLIESNGHLKPSIVKINGYEDELGNTQRAASYINWIRDYVKNLGIADASTLIHNNLNLITVQLAYKMSGFSDKKFIELLAEQFSPSSVNDSIVVPEENYSIELFKGAPLDKLSYSAVIVEKSANGYTVSGYDLYNPYFTLIPSLPNNNSYTIEVGGTRAVIYNDFKNQRIVIPYGFEFTKKQEVVDFLVSYQRHLASQGFIFEDRDNQLNEKKDFILSAKEFLHWSDQGWKQGNIIVLSPVSDNIKIFNDTTVVDEVTNTVNGSRVLDINYQTIRKNNFTISRESGLFSLKVISTESVGLATFNFVQYEHLLILDNTTVFNDVIYVPETGNRQFRLKLIGAKTGFWNGGLELPGYIFSDRNIEEWLPGVDYLKGTLVEYKSQLYTALQNVLAADQFQVSNWQQINSSAVKTGLISNFATNSSQSLKYYDINDQPFDETLQIFSNSLIGFRPREYFTNLGIDVTTQSKFYQGIIKQGGTINAINALRGAKFNILGTQPLSLFENWAIRVGEYGSLEINDFIEFILPEENFKTNPSVFEVNGVTAVPDIDVNIFTETSVYKKGGAFKKNFLREESKDLPLEFKPLPVAGFVNLDDVNYTVFDIKNYADYKDVADEIGTGFTIWTARDLDNHWNVYRATLIPGAVFILRYQLESQVEFVVNVDHGLIVNDLVVLKNFDPRYNGVYRVDSIIDSTRFLVTMYQNLQDIIDSEAVIALGLLYKLVSSKLATPNSIIDNTPVTGYIKNDKFWVEDIDDQGTWGVYTKTDPWAHRVTLELDQYTGSDHFGKSVAIDRFARYVYAGAPDNSGGRVAGFIRGANIDFDRKPAVAANHIYSGVTNFGQVLATGLKDNVDSYLAVADPTAASGKGVVYIYKNLGLINILLDIAGVADDSFGYSLAMSDDAQYLYIGAPGANKVFCYSLDYPRLTSVQEIIASGATTFTLQTTATVSIDLIVLAPLSGAEFLPTIDYTLAQVTNAITGFTKTGTPALGTGAFYNISATGGTGTGARFRVERSAVTGLPSDEYVVTLENGGSGYTNGETLTIAGASVGGTTPANNITVTVTGVGAATNIVFGVAPALFLKIAVQKKADRYTLIDSLPLGSEVAAFSRFGSALACSSDGSTIAVGAESANVGGVSNAGSVYVYHRTKTEIVTNGLTNIYTLPDNFNNVYRVFFNGTLIYDPTNVPAGQSAVYFITGGNTLNYGDSGTATLPRNNKFFVETNQFVLDQILYQETPTSFVSNFGSKLAMCSSGCNIYVVSSEYKEQDYTAGLVTRFLNLGRVYGTVIGTITNPTVTAGQRIVINDRTITFTGTTLTSVINNINNAVITGVRASNANNRLRIDSDVVLVGQKLSLLNGSTGTPLADLGIETYQYTQIIQHPENDQQSFGISLAVDQDSGTLAVGSAGADIFQPMAFDPLLVQATIFDSGTTTFANKVKDSGAVFIFNLLENPNEDADNPSLFAYSQKLFGPNLEDNVDFGAGIGLTSDYLFVGLANATVQDTVAQGGLLHYYYNENAKSGWELSRNKEPRVDTSAIGSAFIYNKVSQEILDFFDYIDPAKGKLLGVVDQELDYKEEYDPASYNKSSRTDTINNTSFYWYDRQVGRTWWDLSTVSFIDYEQASITYRVKNWGRLFPGSQVTIYEWVESNFLPSQYVDAVGDGVPKYTDDSAYSSISLVDPATGIITQKYYYWVSGKTGVDTLKAKRTLSVRSLENYITNPKDQNIPYLGLIATNAVAIYNVENKLSGDDIVLHLTVSESRNNNLIHNEWQLVQQGASADSIPNRAVQKLKDSLGGFDVNGNAVPSPLLSPQDKLGILNNPIQSIVHDRLAALRLYVETLNSTLIKYPILLTNSVSLLKTEDPLPISGYDLETNNVNDLLYIDTSQLPDGYKILVTSDSDQNGLWTLYKYNSSTGLFDLERIQGFKTTRFWNPIDWYDSSYQVGKTIDYIVNIYSDIQALTPQPSSYIKVLDGGNGNWLLYEVQSDGSLNLVGTQNGTLQIKTEVYDPSLGSGYDTLSFDITALDPNPTQEFRNIYDGVSQQILVGNLSTEFNGLFLTLLNFIFIEQKSPDWVIKTSFIDVFHSLRALDQFPNFVKDNQDFYIDYINEIKPYRTKVREYIPNYFNQDPLDGNFTDFDLPSAYDSRYRTYRAPDVTLESDQELLQQDEYVNWYENYKFKITDYIVGNIGLNYILPPNVEITGGGGSGATAITTLFGNGSVSGVIVTNAGSGYTSTPNVFINGDGVGATAYPLLKNEYYSLQANLSYNLVRSIDTVLKFDRFEYSSNLQIWEPNASYPATIVTSGNTTNSVGNLYVSSGNIIVYNNNAYLATNAEANVWQASTIYPVNSLITFGGNVYTTTGNVFATSSSLINTANVQLVENFDFTRFSRIESGNVLLNALDRIVSYYSPEVGMPGKDLEQLVSGIVYPASKVAGPVFRANAFEVSSNLVSFNYEGLTINSGNVSQLNFLDRGFELNKAIRISANVPFQFQNNGYFKIISVDRDTMTLTGQPVETTYKITLDTTISAQAGDYITQANTAGNAWVLQSVTNSNKLDIIYINPEFTTVAAGNVFANLQISKNGTPLSANISSITNFDKTFTPIASGGNVDVTISYLDEDFIIDSNIYSTYLDTALGTRPQDINIVGGAYYDIYSSHAPEELVPGRMYDSLEMRVFTNTVANTSTYGFRVFKPMSANIEYTRISANSTTTLAANLSLSDDQIIVSDVTKLPDPNPVAGIPGVIFVNGEKITYYQKYDAAKLATAVPWTANTVFALSSLIVFDSNTYLTTGNVFANANSYVNSANIQLITANSLRQIRRAVDGTGAANIILLGNLVSDSSESTQLIPDAQIANISTVSGNITVTSNVTYKVVLGEPITANIGDYITQFVNNTGNARILSNVTNSKVVAVDIVSPGFYANANLDYTLTLSSPITANRGDRIGQFFDNNTYLLELSSPITSNIGDYITQFQGNTYRLELSSPISANVGDYITQFVGNLSNLLVIGSNTVSNIVNVQFVTANVENLQFATNVGTRVNIANLYSSGGSVFSQTTANIVSITLNGFSPNVFSVGNANLRVTQNVVNSNVIPVQFITGTTSVIQTAANIGTRVNIANIQAGTFNFSTANISSITLAPNVQSNLRVRANVTSSVTVPVEFISGNLNTLKTAANVATRIINGSTFTNVNIVSINLEGFGSNLFGNAGTRINLVSTTSGVSSLVANIVSLQPLGQVTFTSNAEYPRILLSNGNVVLTSTTVFRSNIWEQFSTTLQNSTTVGAQFIRLEPSYIP
jgi:hypothetical protein